MGSVRRHHSDVLDDERAEQRKAFHARLKAECLGFCRDLGCRPPLWFNTANTAALCDLHVRLHASWMRMARRELMAPPGATVHSLRR